MTIILPRIFSRISEICAGMSTKLGSGTDTEFGMNLSYSVGDDPSNVEKNRERYF